MREIELKLTTLCAEKNKNQGKNAKYAFEAGYTSSARTVLRALWFLDFLSMFFQMAYNDREVHLSHCAKEAYGQCLGPHHTWVVR